MPPILFKGVLMFIFRILCHGSQDNIPTPSISGSPMLKKEIVDTFFFSVEGL